MVAVAQVGIMGNYVILHLENYLSAKFELLDNLFRVWLFFCLNCLVYKLAYTFNNFFLNFYIKKIKVTQLLYAFL